jgi:hypothetical protein
LPSRKKTAAWLSRTTSWALTFMSAELLRNPMHDLPAIRVEPLNAFHEDRHVASRTVWGWPRPETLNRQARQVRQNFQVLPSKPKNPTAPCGA